MTLKSVGFEATEIGESSAVIQKRVEKARLMQKERYAKGGLNGNVPFAQLLKVTSLATTEMEKIQTVCFEEKWSNRTQTKLIWIARTIADLAGEATISSASIEEAISWKRMASNSQIGTNEMIPNG